MTSVAASSPTGAELSAPDISTSRIDLVSITPKMLRADFAKSPEFTQLIDAQIPAGWPSDGWDEDAYNYLLNKMEKYPDAKGWSRYIAVKPAEGRPRILAGGCGLLGPIELTDDPEIGYGLLPDFQHHGYATEAVAALVEWIFTHPHINSINAQTFPTHQASLAVLARLNFQPAGPGPGPEEGTLLYRKCRD